MSYKGIDRKMFASENDEDMVTPAEMKENLEMIKLQIPTFKKNFSEVSKNKLNVTNVDINRIIEKSIQEADLNEADTRILDGFYETWMAVFMMVGSDREALEIVFKMIHSK